MCWLTVDLNHFEYFLKKMEIKMYIVDIIKCRTIYLNLREYKCYFLCYFRCVVTPFLIVPELRTSLKKKFIYIFTNFTNNEC